jgi:hypothetical protein
MERHSVEAIVRALNGAGVRYLITGGLAVVAHGYLRFTADVDLILDLEATNVRRTLIALQSLGYCPRVPVPAEQFIDADIRARWIREKGMKVFSLISALHSKTDVDLFAESPLDFERANENAVIHEVSSGVRATFVSLEDLLFLKKLAGRPLDLEDIRQLEQLHQRKCVHATPI